MRVVFKPHAKQEKLFDAAFSGIYKYIFFGGAAGGGKSYGSVALLIALCKIFPGSKWHIVRRDFTKLRDATIPTFNKVVPKGFVERGRVIDGIARMVNGSEIHFVGENYAHDKDLTWMDGLETNGFLFEEVQELQKKTFEKAKLRAGRHIIDPMPPILVLLTGNPSQNWSKDTFRIPFVEGTLKAPYLFIESFMPDNPTLPKEYLENMETLDSITYRRYVLGDWDAIAVDCPFAYAFDHKKHVHKLTPPRRAVPLYLSFDFNIDPITAIVGTHTDKIIRVHKEYRLRNSNIYELCQAIKKDWPGYYFYVTGDASGANSSAMVQENINYYTIIMNELNLEPSQMRVPSHNPIISNNRVLVNSILEKHPDFKIDDGCKYLIEDLQYCEVNRYGEIDKTRDKHRTHLLDCFRYYLDTFHSMFIRYIP